MTQRVLLDRDVQTPEAMHSIGLALAAVLAAGDLVVLTGPLGAGKTTLSRGVGQGLEVVGTVSSPTFVIARTHKRQGGGAELVHVDAYRLTSIDEFDDLDIDMGSSITLVEWGRPFVADLTQSWLDIEIERDHTGATETRHIVITGFGPRWDGVELDSRAQVA
ncbi:MAG: tRNA (adenosine(37)-N6)-threonylcarbamoyltransferase complex ATPase subunit type 1 TsaE [Micrococcales bacterium]